MAKDEVAGPYSSIQPFLGQLPTWYPEDVRLRVAAYEEYDQIYWNDDTQFSLRVLAGEEPIYIPNARTIVDTTSHYLLKGLSITAHDPEKHKDLDLALKSFMNREEFDTKFHIAKHSGVSRGDFVLHLTADPLKAEGERISINSVHPGLVVPIYDDDDVTKLLRVHLVDITQDEKDSTKQQIHKLTYEYEGEGSARKVFREEAIYETDPEWWGPTPKKVRQIIPRAPLSDKIRTIPVYWFKNVAWEGDPFGSSELRGFLRLLQGVSQSVTDEQTALALEGLGVYATDSGRPVDDKGEEIDWLIHPASVMEVVSGSYFRRVEGIGTLKPFQDHIGYLEGKLMQGTALTDVALGQVDVQTAQSGIALAIKFMPTLAKIEERDKAGISKLKQLFHDWKIWMGVYENQFFDDEEENIEIAIGDKLPGNDVETVNELNNMFDRRIISKKYYRAQMTKLGHVFPVDIDDEIVKEQEEEARLKALSAPAPLQDNAEAAANGSKPPPQSAGGRQNAPNSGPNRSNNRNRPNESAGTEAK